MGWISFAPPSNKTPRQIIVDEMTGSDGQKQVLAITNSGGVAYVAFRTRTGDVIGVVVLYETNRGEFSYKIIDETMGPFEVLRTVLTGTGDCGNVDWRFLGLSMPMWSLVWFLLLAAWALYAGFRARGPRKLF